MKTDSLPRSLRGLKLILSRTDVELPVQSNPQSWMCEAVLISSSKTDNETDWYGPRPSPSWYSPSILTTQEILEKTWDVKENLSCSPHQVRQATEGNPIAFTMKSQRYTCLKHKRNTRGRFTKDKYHTSVLG